MVRVTVNGTAAACVNLKKRPSRINVVYGLGGRDVATSDIERVYNHLFNIVETGESGSTYLHMGQRSNVKEVL